MTPEDFKPDYLVPGTRIGAYVVRGLLGQGGSSSVYEVESAEGHRFALKLCRYHGGAAYGTSEWRVDQRYSRSIVCLQLLKGRRNVAELYAHDRYPDPLHGYQYLVQELVPGGLFITDWVKRESPPLRKLVGVFGELAELCGVMAGMGICHRDLKPPNILVAPDGTPKIIDFENAICPHVEPVTRRAASEVPGTGGWQSPELCKAILEEQSKKKRKKAFDFLPWGDLFSLGVVFYECLTGEHPFDTSLPDELLLAEVAFEKPIHPVRLSNAVPFGLNKVVMKLLEKQPKARYRDGAEVANDLRRLLKKVKDRRWAKPFKQPVPDEEEAPVLSLVSVLVLPETPVPANEKESEVPMPDTPHSKPHGADSGVSAEAEAPRAAALSPQSAKPDVSSADTDVVRSDELDTAEPRGQPESEPAVGTVLDFGDAGAYSLERRLGRGGMGEVYLARQVGAAGFVQSVAIKRVRPGVGPAVARSFVDEARILARLNHPNIARVYGFHEWQGSYYLVMEYVEGQSLYELLKLAHRKRHRFSEPVACAVMAEVAEALDYAHQAKDEKGRPLEIVHRDVSPTNILIAKTGRVVLLDFGVALSKDEERAATPAGDTFIKGKAPYVSPEQVKHLPLDARSDYFSVGTILVEMLTGEAPFGWTNDYRTFKRVETVTPEYVASLLPGVSKPLLALCQKLLAHHPDQRFAGGEVAKALRHHAGLGEGPQSILAEVEKLQTLPDTTVPPPSAAEAAARSLSGVKRARRTLALASALMLAATLALFFWHVPREAVPVPSSAPLPGPAVSLSRPPEKSIAPGPPVPQPSPLVCKPNKEDGPTVAAGPARLRRVAAAPPSGALPLALAYKKTRSPVTAPPAERRTAEAVRVSPASDEATGTLRDEPPAAQGQTASYVKVSGDMLSVDHALAALLAQGRVDLTPFRAFEKWRLHEDGVDVEVSILTPKKDESEAGKGKVAVVLNVRNRNLELPWELKEIRLTTATGEHPWPFALGSDGESISRGQSGTVAIVMDLSTFDPAKEGEELVLDVVRTGGDRQVSAAFAVRELVDR